MRWWVAEKNEHDCVNVMTAGVLNFPSLSQLRCLNVFGSLVSVWLKHHEFLSVYKLAVWGNVCSVPSRSWFTVVHFLFKELESSAHLKTYERDNMFTWREECVRFVFVWWYCVLCVQECARSFLKKPFLIWKTTLHLCPTASSLLSWRQSVSAHLHQSCYPGWSWLSVVCRVHAIHACHTSCVGKWHGFHWSVWAWMGSAENYWSVLDNNCIVV